MFTIRKAERKQAKLRLALVGVAGCGKTLGAIRIASGMGKKFILIDTEYKSADLYADVANFDVINLEKPFTPEKYINAINYCEDMGYEVIIIDSISHAWAGEGGILDMQDSVTKASSSKNSYMAWKEVTPWQNKLINTILQSPSHIIATMRAKTHHDIVEINGKKKPVKIGLAPVQREGVDYEFTVVLDIDKDSKLYSSSKDRTRLFEGNHEKISEETGIKLMRWLNDGKLIEDIKREEIDEINELKNNISKSNLNNLKEAFKIAKSKYPHLNHEFIKIATDRKNKLENEELH